MRPLSQTSNAQTTEVDKGRTVNRAQELHIRAKSQINKEMRSELLGEGENNAAKNTSLLIQCTCKLVYLIFCWFLQGSCTLLAYIPRHITKVFLAQYFHKTKDFQGTLPCQIHFGLFLGILRHETLWFLKVNWIINLINLLVLKVNKEPCLFSRQ